MLYEEKRLSSATIFEGKILKVYKDEVLLPNGEKSSREIIKHRGASAVLVLDEDENVFLCRQFRYALGRDLLEIPAGKLEEGRTFEECAAAEAEEEVGIIPESLEPLAEIYPSCGYTNELIKLYLVRGYHDGSRHLDEDEFLDVVKMPFHSLLEKIDNGEIEDAKTIIAALKYDRLRNAK